MIKECALCKEEKEMMDSHIIPKFFYKYIISTSPLKGIRNAKNPNKRDEDGIKRKLLCKECELRFSKYEDDFSQNVFSKVKENSIYRRVVTEKTIYFCMSLIWRGLILAKEPSNIDRNDKKILEKKEGYGTLFLNEKEKIELLLEELRNYLIGKKDFSSLKKYKFHLIPTTFKMEKLSKINNNSFINQRVTDSGSFSAFSEEKESFNYLAYYVKVPFFLLVVEIIPNKEYKIKGAELIKDRKIIENNIELNFMAKKYLESLEKSRKESKEKLSSKQERKINERIKQELNKNPEAFLNSPAVQAIKKLEK